LESKVIAVIDAFDAMTGGDKDDEKRNYRKPKTPEEAFAELERCSGTQFDADVVRAFERVWRAS
jgi:HD-GYP domain-containing protein (c-di-GMP phosphodiesterase class II)